MARSYDQTAAILLLLAESIQGNIRFKTRRAVRMRDMQGGGIRLYTHQFVVFA
jgi:hypothetical protein